MLIPTIEGTLFSFFIWLIAFIVYRPAIKTKNQGKGNYILFFLIVSISVVFAFTVGDFYHYYPLYKSLARGFYDNSMEDFYNDLVKHIPDSYFLWRFAVWGASTFLLIQTYKRVNSPVRLSCLIFVLILIINFGSSRNTLGYMLLYYSMTFIFKPLKNKTFSFILAITGVFLSTYLHKSMPLYIALIIIAFVPMNKNTYRLSLLAFPFIYISFGVISNYLLTLDLGGGDFEKSGILYLEGENFSRPTVFGYIQMSVARTPILILLYLLINNILDGTIKDKFVIHFAKYSYFLIYISFIFFNQETSSFLSQRFWDASLFPIALAIPLGIYLKSDRKITISFYLLLLANIYSFAYC